MVHVLTPMLLLSCRFLVTITRKRRTRKKSRRRRNLQRSRRRKTNLKKMRPQLSRRCDLLPFLISSIASKNEEDNEVTVWVR